MNDIEILIVTHAVVLQQGLGALLESLPAVQSVKAIKELSSAYTWIEVHQPQVVLLDEDVTGRNPETVLDKIQAVSPKTQRAILVNDVTGVRLLLDYAEAVLIKGIAPSAVTTIVTKLISVADSENKPPKKGGET